MTDKVIDERVERINEKAGYYAFWILISSLAVAIASSLYLELEARNALEALCFVGIYCYFHPQILLFEKLHLRRC